MLIPFLTQALNYFCDHFDCAPTDDGAFLPFSQPHERAPSLLHGAHMHLQHQREFLTCLRPAPSFSDAALAVPLSPKYVPNRKFRGCWASQFYKRMGTALGTQTAIPNVHDNIVSTYCCNTWLVTRPTIQQHPLRFWEHFMNVSLWHICGGLLARRVARKEVALLDPCVLLVDSC